MPTPTIPACFQMRLLITVKHLSISNMFYYHADEYPATLAEVRHCGNSIGAELITAIKAVYTTDATLHGFHCSRQTGAGSSLEDYTVGISQQGDQSTGGEEDESAGESDALPPSSALIVRKLTGMPGPNKRGRWFFGGICEQIQVNGHVHPDHRPTVLGIATIAAQDITVAAGGTYAGGVFHARHWDRKTNTLEPIMACRVGFVMGTRRDRDIRANQVAVVI